MTLGDRLINADPFEHHWSNRAGSENTSGTGLRNEFRDGARRFDVGGHCNDISLSMLNASLEQVLAWGPDRVQSYCEALMQPLDDYLFSSAYGGVGRGDHSAHILGIRGAPDLLERALEELRERNVSVSWRGNSIRVSPHVYNTPADIDSLIEALIAASR